jgi:hypothetical protein
MTKISHTTANSLKKKARKISDHRSKGGKLLKGKAKEILYHHKNS